MENCSYAPQNNTVRSQMEGGAAKMRRRFTRVPEDVTFSLLLECSQVQILQDFVEITCADVLTFWWRDFRRPFDTGNDCEYRFKSRPKITPISDHYWRVDLELELMCKPPQGTFVIADEFGQSITTSIDEEITT